MFSKRPGGLGSGTSSGRRARRCSGLPFDTPPPYAPVDEDYPGRPETAYSLSKLLGEEMAKQFCRWDPELKIIGLRFSNVMEPRDYARFPDFDADARLRKWNLWAYIDARDAAQAIRKALEPDQGRRGLHHRQRRHGHVTAECGADGGDLPDVPLKDGRRAERDAAVDREGAAGARLRAAAQLARQLRHLAISSPAKPRSTKDRSVLRPVCGHTTRRHAIA